MYGKLLCGIFKLYTESLTKVISRQSKLFLEILVLLKYFVKSWVQGKFSLKWCISNENFTEMAKFRTELGKFSWTLDLKRNFFFSFDQKHYISTISATLQCTLLFPRIISEIWQEGFLPRKELERYFTRPPS